MIGDLWADSDEEWKSAVTIAAELLQFPQTKQWKYASHIGNRMVNRLDKIRAEQPDAEIVEELLRHLSGVLKSPSYPHYRKASIVWALGKSREVVALSSIIDFICTLSFPEYSKIEDDLVSVLLGNAPSIKNDEVLCGKLRDWVTALSSVNATFPTIEKLLGGL